MQSLLYTKIGLIVKKLSTFQEVSYKNFNRKKFRKLLKKHEIDINVKVSSSTFWEIHYNCNDDLIDGNVQLNLLINFSYKDESVERTTPINRKVIAPKKLDSVFTDLDYEVYRVMESFCE